MTKNEKKKVSIKKWIIKHAPAIVISFAAFVLLVGVLLAVFQAKEELVQYSIKNENVYMIVAGEKFDYFSEITLDHEDKVTKLYINETFEKNLYNEPLYFANKDEAIFPNTMAVIFPIEGKIQKKVNRYTTVNGEGLQAILSNQGLKYALTDGFLYDGKDIYFFVEDGTLTWGDQKIEISAMSFVSCYYHEDLYVYDYESKKAMVFEKVDEDILATFDNYSVNISYDSVIVGEDSFLLQKNVEALPILKQ